MKPVCVESWLTYLKEYPDFTGCLINKHNDAAWYQVGLIHREDGPAVVWAGGTKAYYLHGAYYNEQEWLVVVRRIKLERILGKIA